MQPVKAGESAAELFNSGWNCAEAVFLAIHEQMNGHEPPVNLVTPLGRGLGSKRTCGAVTGAAVALGLGYGRKKTDRGTKEVAYDKVRQLLDAFQATFHSLDCEELIRSAENESGRKRRCPRLVQAAAESAARLLQEKGG